MASLSESGINESAYVKADDLFQEDTQFAMHHAVVTEGNIRGKVVKSVEIDIEILKTGERKILTLGYNPRRANLVRWFEQGGEQISPVKLGKVNVDGQREPAWTFVDPVSALRDANAEQERTPF